MTSSASIPSHLVSSPWLVFSTYPTESEAVDYFSFNPHPQWRSSKPFDDEEEEAEDDIEEYPGYDSPNDGRLENYQQDDLSQSEKARGPRMRPPSDQVWSGEEDDEDDEEGGEDFWSDGGSSFAGTSDRTLVDFEFDESPPTTPGEGWTYAASTESVPSPSTCRTMPEYTPLSHSVNMSDGNTRSSSPMSLSSSSSSSTGISHAFPLTPIQEILSARTRTTSSTSSSSSHSSHLQRFTMVLPPLKKTSSPSSLSDLKGKPMRALSIKRDVSIGPGLEAQRGKELVHIDTPFPSF